MGLEGWGPVNGRRAAKQLTAEKLKLSRVTSGYGGLKIPLRHNCVMENLITKRIQQYLESTIHHRRKLRFECSKIPVTMATEDQLSILLDGL